MAALDRPVGLPEAGVTLFHVDGGAVGAAPAVAGRTATAPTAMSTAGTRRHHDVAWLDPLLSIAVPVERPSDARRELLNTREKPAAMIAPQCSCRRRSPPTPALDMHFDRQLFHCQLGTVNSVDRSNGVNWHPGRRPPGHLPN